MAKMKRKHLFTVSLCRSILHKMHNYSVKQMNWFSCCCLAKDCILSIYQNKFKLKLLQFRAQRTRFLNAVGF